MSGKDEKDNAKHKRESAPTNVYAQLLADEQSIQPVVSKLSEHDIDFEPATRSSSANSQRLLSPRLLSPRFGGLSAAAHARLAVAVDDDHLPQKPAPKTTSQKSRSERAPGEVSGQVSAPQTAPNTPSQKSRSERAPGEVSGQVSAHDNGVWGFAYPTNEPARSSSGGAASEDSSAQPPTAEDVYNVPIVSGAGVAAGWTARTPETATQEVISGYWTKTSTPRGGTTRAPTPFGDTQSNTPRTQSTTTTPRSKGYVPVKTATKLDIGDLDEIDENALFRADLLNKGDGNRSISQEVDLMKGWNRFYRSDEDWQPWEQHAPIPIKPWFRAVMSLVQLLVGGCCIQVGLKEEDMQCQATFCLLLVVCGIVQLAQCCAGLYMIIRQVGAEGEEPRAVLWFLEVVLWISVLHAVVTNSCENLKLQATASVYLSVSALLWLSTLVSWLVWYTSGGHRNSVLNWH